MSNQLTDLLREMACACRIVRRLDLMSAEALEAGATSERVGDPCRRCQALALAEAMEKQYQRMFDLVRQMRMELYNTELITNGEYALLASDHTAVARLESYDEIRTRLQEKADAFDSLKAVLLNQPWHKRCEIIPNYMPPYPREDTRPTVQVRYNDGSEYPPFLRYSQGPAQGFFWDIYGEDMQSIALAIVAISRAPAPVSVAPITIYPDIDAVKAARAKEGSNAE